MIFNNFSNFEKNYELFIIIEGTSGIKNVASELMQPANVFSVLKKML